MSIDQRNRLKLDADLARLLDHADFVADARFPVFVTPESGKIAEVATAIEDRGGTVRHILKHVESVAAWIPFGAIGDLANLSQIRRIELSGTTQLA